jgi:triosephosphate isomerase
MQEPERNRTIKYLIGNWKANKTQKEALSWIRSVKESKVTIHARLKIVLCPSFIHLSLFKSELKDLSLGGQDLSPYGDGAYTGAVTARMLSDLVEFVILGHSERRRYFSDSANKVALKAIQALDNNITPIIAVAKDNWRQQLNALGEEIIKKSIIMYEPPESISRQVGPIGKGEAASLDEVKAMILKIKQDRAPQAVIYGGSVKSHNIQKFLETEIIDGVLPGSASLNSQEWIKMINFANQAMINIDLSE